ncbi:MAG: type IV secretion system DNA-binding domain-containing protein [Candidatus Pacebacteria bacterium]|nr:type IV secretion system DNA-binding domain-containing protein [Candidatus Paceibacterota bacterium]MDD5013136.1 type IV secretion system DNA-binding domain-containing protein [Candidatus Paceibacterota bacterium]
MEKENITFFGKTTFRGEKKRFGIKDDDKRRHVYIIGKTGMGKTELLKNMVVQDILNGKGVGFIDPHGEASEELLRFIPEERINDVVYFNPSDIENPIAFNIMEDVSAEYRHLIAGGLMGVFKKIWPDVWSSRMEYILNNSILALLEVPGSTLLGVNRLLSDSEWREGIINQLKDPIVKAFWLKEFARYTQRYEVEATAAIQNKIGQFISAPLIRNIIGQEKSTIDMRKIMDEKKILIMNLSKGKIGEDSSRLLGALLVTKLQLAAMSRVNISEQERKDFILYIDEFQNFSTDSFANILSEARKYRLSLILAHQYIAQMEEKVRDAVFGNVGTMITFRIGADDAEFLEKELSPEYFIEDMVNLPKQNIIVKLMINGITSKPFSAETLPPAKNQDKSFEGEIIEFSQRRYGIKRSIVEKRISEESGIDSFISVAKKNNNIELYDAVCQSCGKSFKAPFKPDGKRPVYCKNCLKKRDNNNTFNDLPTISLKESAKDFIPPVKKNRSSKEENIKTNKKEIDLIGLKEVIKKAKEEKKKEKGIIHPGETIKFD